MHDLISTFLLSHEHAVLMFCWKLKVVVLDKRDYEWSGGNFGIIAFYGCYLQEYTHCEKSLGLSMYIFVCVYTILE